MYEYPISFFAQLERESPLLASHVVRSLLERSAFSTSRRVDMLADFCMPLFWQVVPKPAFEPPPLPPNLPVFFIALPIFRDLQQGRAFARLLVDRLPFPFSLHSNSVHTISSPSFPLNYGYYTLSRLKSHPLTLETHTRSVSPVSLFLFFRLLRFRLLLFEADLFAPSSSTPSTRSRFVEDFFSSALDDEDQLQRMQSLHQQEQQQQQRLNGVRPASPSLSALSSRSELIPLDRSVNGDGSELEPSVIEEVYEEEGGRIERLGGKAHL